MGDTDDSTTTGPAAPPRDAPKKPDPPADPPPPDPPALVGTNEPVQAIYRGPSGSLITGSGVEMPAGEVVTITKADLLAVRMGLPDHLIDEYVE
jgi:hypothetical protein